MIQTASILWAVLATGGAVAVYILMRSRYIWALDGWNRACAIHRENTYALEERTAGVVRRNAELAERLGDALMELRTIKQNRKASAKHARQAQLSQQRAKVLEQASKLVAPKVDRIAA